MIYLYTLIISTFFSGLLYYLINFTLTPYDADNLISIKNLIIISVIFIAAFTSAFSLVHMLLDKVFFRKFYQGPRMFLGLRRGVLLGLVFVGLAWMRVFDFWQLHIVLLAFSLALLLEALFLSVNANFEEIRGHKEDG